MFCIMNGKVCINIFNNNNERIWMWKILYLIFFVFVINNIDLKKKIYMKELRLVMLILKKIDWLIDWFYEWIDGLMG